MELLVPERIVPARRLPSYIKLDMAFGVGAGTSLSDKSRYRSHGTISGASWATGAHGYCLDFNPATPDYVEIPAAYDQLDFTSEKFSAVVRIQFDDVDSTRRIFSRGVLNNDGYSFYISSSGKLNFWTTQSGDYQVSRSSNNAITAATWYTIGISRDGASVKIYINGVEDTDAVGTHVNPDTCSREFLIGIYYDKATNPFDGKIEFLRVIGGIALSASEQLAYHNALA